MTKKELTIAVRKPAGLPLGPQKRNGGVSHRYKQKDLLVCASLSSQRINKARRGRVVTHKVSYALPIANHFVPFPHVMRIIRGIVLLLLSLNLIQTGLLNFKRVKPPP